MTTSRLRKSGIILALAACLAALAVSTAQARPAALPTCDAATATKPFLPWLDLFSYVYSPDGGFEAGGAGWKLSGGAKVVSGNEPFYAHAKGETRSLLLPAGSSATSPSMCIGLLYPAMRFFQNAPLLATMRVQVLFNGPLGILKLVDGGVALGTGKWAPSLPMLMLANLTAPVGTNSISFRFTPIGKASWTVDDVYVDPWRSR